MSAGRRIPSLPNSPRQRLAEPLNGICLRYSEDDFANCHSYSEDCRWPISLGDLADHYSEVERSAFVAGERNGLRQFPDGSFLAPRSARQIDRVFIDSNAGSLGPDLF